MTNLPSGSSKRAWEVGEAGDDYQNGNKRHRSSHRDEHKDWRDVHLKNSTSGPSSTHSSSYDDGYGRRKSPDDYKRRNRSRDYASRRDDRDRERDRDRDRERDKERPRDRERERDRDRDRYRRDRHRDELRKDGRSTPRSVSPTRTNGSSHQPMVAVVPMDDEKEEGEISPRPSPPPTVRSRRSLSPRPSHASVRSYSEAPTPAPPQPSRAPPSQPTPPAPKDIEMELELPVSPPPVEDLIAQRRAKRQAIRAKYTESVVSSVGVSPSPATPASTTQPVSHVHNADPVPPVSRAASIGMSVDELSKGGTRDSMSTSPPPPTASTVVNVDANVDADGPEPAVDGTFELAKGEDEEKEGAVGEQGAEQVMAADYDPSKDRREDEHRRLLGGAVANGKVEDKVVEVIDEEEEVEETEEEDELEDMFAVVSDTKPKKTKKVKKVKKVSKPAPALITTNQLLDTASDAEGYYNIILGEQLDGGRYQVFSSLGKGMFANVVRARVLLPPPEGETGTEVGREVAIKIVRSQESMYRAGQKEAQILHKLRQADLEDKKHIVRLERTFEHRGHLCLVFESLSMNLRDVVKRFGKDVGLNIRAVRAYAHQLFLALSLLKKLNVMHADIKPDNILVNEQKTVLKLCDLGSASDASENEITPYLVSRFYRAPEIILGIPYDPALDIWSIGCTLYELYTGKILFPGRTNNQMLLLMMELKGRFNAKMLKKASFHDVYFDDMGGFASVERDKITGADVVRTVHISKPSRDLRSRLMPPSSVKMKEDESKLLMSFVDLLDKCLMLDPARRITPREALAHPFIRG